MGSPRIRLNLATKPPARNAGNFQQQNVTDLQSQGTEIPQHQSLAKDPKILMRTHLTDSFDTSFVRL